MSKTTFRQVLTTIITLSILACVLTYIGTTGPIRPPTTARAPKQVIAPECQPEELWIITHYESSTAIPTTTTVCACLFGKKECTPYNPHKEM